MKTVQQLFNASEIDGWLYLIRFDNDQFLALKRQKDGRIDLVDVGCDNTGSDLSGWSYEQLETEISNWLNCIEASEQDKESAWEQVARA
jgi:hypothetical protein